MNDEVTIRAEVFGIEPFELWHYAETKDGGEIRPISLLFKDTPLWGKIPFPVKYKE